MAKQKDELVPYDLVSPGFEAVYTGETSAVPVRESQMVSALCSDADGNLISQWCTIPWVFPDDQGQWDESLWGNTIKRLCDMQSMLGPLSDDIRQLRAHITSLIPCDSGLPVTVDEVLLAIARGKLDGVSFPAHRESTRPPTATIIRFATLKVGFTVLARGDWASRRARPRRKSIVWARCYSAMHWGWTSG